MLSVLDDHRPPRPCLASGFQIASLMSLILFYRQQKDESESHLIPEVSLRETLRAGSRQAEHPWEGSLGGCTEELRLRVHKAYCTEVTGGREAVLSS